MGVPAVEVTGVGRVFGRGRHEVVALRDVTFEVAEGQILGVLGSNGAGKTTLTKILATLLEPTTGTARVFGHDVRRELRAVRRLTGVVFGGDRGFYGALSGRDNLRYFAMLAGVGRRTIRAKVDDALAGVGLAEAARRPVETYSKGMRQRLHIALGLVAEPRLLLLDEPTVGLDPVEAERLRTTIAALRRTGVSILLTSHYLLDIERLADRVLVVAQGRVMVDTPAAEFARSAGFAATVTLQGRGPLPARLDSYRMAVESVEDQGGVWTARLRVPDWGGEMFQQLSAALADADVLGVDVAPVRLEDVYALVMQRLAQGEPARTAGAAGTDRR
ncbi:ABC transporter ATP-binding protein [Micromonospora sp. CPCC 206060]|uniref:ABC transporter ATP-binding protein n=1 Tax=Micromonospora sp. CPCC 206060 TaxID=3122406 RepID=UPI002FF223DF